MDVAAVADLRQKVREQVQRVIVGQDDVIELVLTALLAEGHVLLEGTPGTAKTLLVQTLAASLALEFRRVQFTPDLMPGDVLGTNLFNFQTNRFTLVKGPIFTQILLADEINRTPPKTQAALLQAMQERSVTLDGTNHPLGPSFMVIATQNPIEHEGTYPLPEAQLDRFLFKIKVGYPSRDEERAMVLRHGHRTLMPNAADFGVTPVADLASLTAVRSAAAAVRVAEPLAEYIVDLVRATRAHPALLYGASPRAASMLAAASRAYAILNGRDFAIPDDVKVLLGPVLLHRVVMAPSAELEGTSADGVLKQIVEQTPAPR